MSINTFLRILTGLTRIMLTYMLKIQVILKLKEIIFLVQETVKIMNDHEFERNAPKKFEIEEFAKTERLSKRLSRLGICSRRQAERLIKQGMIKVDGRVVNSNVPVGERK